MRTTVDQRLSLTPEDRVTLRRLADEELDLSLNKTVALGIECLDLLVKMHEEIAEKLEPEIAALYRRVVREMPARFVELKREMAFGWTDETRETPAVQVDGWFITADNGDLIAVNEKGERGRFIRGDVHAAPLPSPKKAVLKPVLK